MEKEKLEAGAKLLKQLYDLKDSRNLIESSEHISLSFYGPVYGSTDFSNIQCLNDIPLLAPIKRYILRNIDDKIEELEKKINEL